MKNVVIVDDDPNITSKLSTLVKDNAGFDTTACTHSAREAMLAIEHFRPGLVIMDIMMPDNDGLTVLRYIQEKCQSFSPHIYVITAMDTPVIQAILADFNVDFVSFKPFENTNVTAILQQIALAEPRGAQQSAVPCPKNPVDVVVDVMSEFELPPHLIGYEFIKTILIFMVDNPTVKRNMYSRVAAIFNCSIRAVSANIDTSIKASMDSEIYKAELGPLKVETLMFLNKLSMIVKKRMRGDKT